MINPAQITKFDRTKEELWEFWLFCMMVAGKSSAQTAKKINAMNCGSLRNATHQEILHTLMEHKVGQYFRLTKGIVHSQRLDLENTNLYELLAIYGVGNKTARFFLLHSRPSYKCAVLDTHILKWLSEKTGLVAPLSTPTNHFVYAKWEETFLDLAEQYWPGESIANVDLKIWRERSGL